MTTTRVVLNSTESTDSGYVPLGTGWVSVVSIARTSNVIPPSIPKSQRYFWLSTWQFGELETIEDLRRGEVAEFETGLDAVRWLLSDEN